MPVVYLKESDVHLTADLLLAERQAARRRFPTESRVSTLQVKPCRTVDQGFEQGTYNISHHFHVARSCFLFRHNSNCIHFHQKIRVRQARYNYYGNGRRIRTAAPYLLRYFKGGSQRLPLHHVYIPSDDVFQFSPTGSQRGLQVLEDLLHL